MSFEEFWYLYPKHVGKGAAQKAWDRLNEAERKAAVEAVKVFAEAWEGAPPERYQFLCHPATFLRQRRWEDDRREWYRQAGRPAPGDETPMEAWKKELVARTKVF